MTTHIDYQTILENGTPKFAVVPFDQFKDLLKMTRHVEPTIPHEVVSATVDGLSPVKAWREYLKLTQSDIATRLDISQSAFAQMERPDANLRISSLQKLADAMGIVTEQLDF